jgi:hypothetical protein
MAHRELTDSSGNDWLIFDVTPRSLEERRQHNRRTSVELAGDEERREDDRRVTVGSHPPRLTKGWLCFERQTTRERRRLQPIPDRWHTLPDHELEQLLNRARPAPQRVTANKNAAQGRR